MKKLWLVIFAAALLIPNFAARAANEDLAAVAGKWSVQKTNETGAAYSQTIEIKKDKFVFKISGPDNKTVLYAEGDVKAESTGAFATLKFYNMKAGKTQAEAESVEEVRNVIYRVDDDTLFIATNFEKERSQKPTLDAYRKESK